MSQYNIPPWRQVVRLGAIAPLALVMPFSGDGTFDFSTVTSADVSLKKPNGEIVKFTNVPISLQTVTGLTLTHVWQAGDVDQLGKWIMYARLYVPGGQVDTDPKTFDVVSRFTPVQRNTP